jgi:signal transduction histidine kinase
MNLVNAYRKHIQRNCIDTGAGRSDRVEYWQDRLFASAVEYVIPLSTIAVIPGVIFSLHIGQTTIAVFDILVLFWIFLIGFVPLPSVKTRKLLFISCLYFVSTYLLVYIGISGPGILFLFAAAVFALLILPVKYAWWWSVINLVACILFTAVIHFNLSPIPEVNNIPVAQWLAIASNLVFLSFTFSLLLPRLINGLSGSIEKQREMQTELYMKNNDLEQYASVIAHDLQTPLRTISGFLNLLEKKYGTSLDDKAKEYIHYAVDGSSHLQHIINGLLDFSRAGKYEPDKFELFSLNEVADEVSLLLRAAIEEKKATITCQPGITLFSNRAGITQIMHNLVSNALKYSKADVPAQISITCKEEPGQCCVCVEDNGIGISNEYFEKIFIIFQRLHTRTEYEGTGIGLAIVKRIVEKLNGKVWVESTPGKGSRFYFSIPKTKD